MRTDALARAAIAALTAVALLAAVPASALAYKLQGFKFSKRTVVYHSTAGKYAGSVKAAARTWNRSGVRFRWKSGPRSRANVIIKIDRNLPSAGLAVTGPIVGGRVRAGTIIVRNDLGGIRAFFATAVLTHEMGHLMGLNHEDRRCAVMNSNVLSRCKVPTEPWRYHCRTLERDDVRGVVKLYGGRVRSVGKAICNREPQPAAPTELAVTTESESVKVQWRATAGARRIRVLRTAGNCATGISDRRAEAIYEDEAHAGRLETTVDYPPVSGRKCYAVFALGKYGRPSAAATVIHLGIPVADFTFSIVPDVPHTVEFVSRSSDDGQLVSGLWSFGDGSTSDEAFPDHQYATAGPKSVTLTVTDEQGNTGSVTKTVQVP